MKIIIIIFFLVIRDEDFLNVFKRTLVKGSKKKKKFVLKK